jgi:hypothetical protein
MRAKHNASLHMTLITTHYTGALSGGKPCSKLSQDAALAVCVLLPMQQDAVGTCVAKPNAAM